MKKIIKFLFTKPIYFILILILIIYLPQAISAPPESVDRQHVSSIAIDVAPEGIELSLLSHVASNESGDKFTRTYILSSTTASSIPYAFYKISSNTGRKISLTHTTTIVVSDEIAKKGLHNYLDYFYRNDNIANDAFIVCVEGKAKDLLAFEKDRINTAGYSLEEVLVYNSENTYFTDDDMESFYKGYFGPTKTSLIAVADMEENPDGEQLLKNGQSNNSGDEQSKEKRVKNFDKLGVLKAGKLVDILEPEMLFGFNAVSNSAKNIFLEIENFSDENLENVDIIFNIDSNHVSYNSTFENNKPVVTISSLLTLTLSSIICDNAYEKYFQNDTNFLTQKMKDKIEQKMKFEFSLFLKRIIQNKADVLGIYTILSNQQHAKFYDWLETLSDKEDFLNEVEFRMQVHSILTT